MSDIENNRNVLNQSETKSGSGSDSETKSDSESETNIIQINSTNDHEPEYTYPEDIIDTTRTPKQNPTNFKQLIGSYVKLLQMKMNTDNMKFKKKFHPDEYNKELSDFVPAFKEEYPFLFKTIISDSDLSILDMFLDNISDIDSGKKNLNDARNDLGHILHEKFVKNKI
jgi:hypothetical protein